MKVTPENMPLLLVLAAGCFVSSMAMRLVDPVVPDIARDLHVSAASVALLASAFTFPYALGQPILGALGDALGKAKIIKISLAMLTLCLGLGVFAPSLDALYVARILGGVAGWLGNYFGWRVSMAAGTVLAFIALAITVWQLQPRDHVERPPFQLRRMFDGYAHVFANPRTVVCFTAVFIEGIVIFGLFPYVALLLEERGAGGLREAGFVLSGFAIGGLLYTALVRVMLTRLGLYNVIRGGAVVSGLGFALLAPGWSWPAEMAIFVVIGAGFYMIHNSLQTQATELAPDNRASAVAAHAFFFFLGQAVGPILYRVGLDRLGSQDTLLVMGAVMAVLGVATAVGLKARAGAGPASGSGA
jgi:predicted MFS family arabinose efflux permease